MNSETPAIKRGDEYITIFAGGPNDGHTGTRISTDGTWDDELTVLTAVDGKETMIDYNFASWRELGGKYYVTYTYDESESEPVEDAQDRGGRQ